MGGEQRRIALGAHDLDTQRAGAAVEFLDTDKDTLGLRFEQDAFRNAFGQRFKQVQTFGRQFGGNRLGHLVIAEDAVDIVVDQAVERAHLDHDVELHALCLAALGLKSADLDLDNVIAQRDPVMRCSPPVARARASGWAKASWISLLMA